MAKCELCAAALPPDASQCRKCGRWQTGLANIESDIISLEEVEATTVDRLQTGPWDPCFGGGLVRTSTTLLGGAPGIGKSTMCLQISETVCELTGRETLYIPTEQALGEIRGAANRIGLKHVYDIKMLRNPSNYEPHILARRPALVVLDSLSGYTAGDEQAKVTFALKIKNLAEQANCAVLILEHVNKEEEITGLMALQHYVDAVLLLTGTAKANILKLETKKNRNGPKTELFLQMTETGISKA